MPVQMREAAEASAQRSVTAPLGRRRMEKSSAWPEPKSVPSESPPKPQEKAAKPSKEV